MLLELVRYTSLPSAGVLCPPTRPPAGWRTTDGTFFEAKGGLNLNHTAEFTRDFLRKPTEHGNVLSALASRKSSDRPLHFFFAGQIRKGGERKPAAPAAPRQSVAAPYRP